MFFNKQEWLKISFLLCVCGFAREIRPNEPYINEYLRGYGHNFTQDEISQKILPATTYTYLAVLVIIFLITDLLRYKPLLIIMGLFGTIMSSMLIWTTSLICAQIAMAFYGMFLACEVAYFAYIYTKVDKPYYSKVTAHTRAAMFLGQLVAGMLSQILLYFDIADYKSLNYMTLCAQIFATLWAFILPKVDQSLYFHRKTSIKNATKLPLSSSAPNPQDTKSIASEGSQQVETPKAFKLLWSHFYNAYSNLRVVQWSIWYAVSLCGYLQIVFYTQVLWIKIEPNMEVALNGGVDAVLTALATVMALVAGYVHAGRLKPLQSLLVVSVFAALEGGAILLCSLTSNIYVSYGGYILFTGLYAFSITVASAEVARYLEEDSFGLVFGVNTFMAVLLQTFLTIIVVSGSVFSLDIRGQYTVYAFYYITISCAFVIAVAVEYLIGRRKENILARVAD
ncbi:thiamine transporter 1-like [Eurosta solidaginis]|uniref:thiamine transporter 1-like n=1 Tax=Eurosta solidaginis TaxID=178769 RepID=UPI003531568A